MNSEPKVGEVWDTTFGPAVITRWLGLSDTWQGSIGADEYCGTSEDLKRRVELREGQVWRRPNGVSMRVVDLYKNGSAWLEATERQPHKYLDAEGMEGVAGMVREGWTLVSEPEEAKETDEAWRRRINSEWDAKGLGVRLVIEGDTFAKDHKPLAEAFAEVARCMQTPRGIVILNRQWCDEQVANPPRWARDGRGVARGERFEAFKVGLCKELAEFSSDRQDCWDGYRMQPRLVDATFVLKEVRQYVDQQCGEAPAWG